MYDEKKIRRELEVINLDEYIFISFVKYNCYNEYKEFTCLCI